MVTVGTLLDGNPDNNFFDREKIIRFNPDGKLAGAMHSFMAGTNLYVVGKNGLFVVTLADGQMWQQDNGDPGVPAWRTPVSRYVVNVYEGALGTYNLNVSDDSNLYKVHRIN